MHSVFREKQQVQLADSTLYTTTMVNVLHQVVMLHRTAAVWTYGALPVPWHTLRRFVQFSQRVLVVGHREQLILTAACADAGKAAQGPRRDQARPAAVSGAGNMQQPRVLAGRLVRR